MCWITASKSSPKPTRALVLAAAYRKDSFAKPEIHSEYDKPEAFDLEHFYTYCI